jgi:hypothetical protein
VEDYCFLGADGLLPDRSRHRAPSDIGARARLHGMMGVGLPVSPIQTFKLAIVDAVGLSKDAIHIYIGVACLLLAVTLGRRRLGSLGSLVPGLLVSIVLEAIDLTDDCLHRGLLIWGPSVKDIVNTNLIPTLFTLVVRGRRR